MQPDAKRHVGGARLAVAIAVALALALCWAPAAPSQTATPTLGTEGTDLSNLPVCGSPAASPSAGSTSAPQRASAGSAQPRTTSQEPLRGTLTLDQEDQETVTSAAFGRSTDPQPLTLVYRVAGCRVTDALALPASPLPTGPVRTAGMRTLPRGAVRIDDVDADGDRYVVHLRISVSSDSAPGRAAAAAPGFSLRPGSYTGFVRLEAPWMHTVATPVTVTRSESDLLVPLLIGLLGSGGGFALFALARKIHHDDLLVKERWVLVFAGIVSVVVGTGSAFFTNYVNQDVWTWSANGLALFTAAFSASTAGVAAGLLTGIYKSSAPAG
jgi:hypothetical protein